MSGSFSMSAGRALRAGLYLIWLAVRHPRSGVTFEFGMDALVIEPEA